MWGYMFKRILAIMTILSFGIPAYAGFCVNIKGQILGFDEKHFEIKTLPTKKKILIKRDKLTKAENQFLTKNINRIIDDCFHPDEIRKLASH
jgi:hypothetical protein